MEFGGEGWRWREAEWLFMEYTLGTATARTIDWTPDSRIYGD